MSDEFRTELTALINKHSLEGRSNTPDFLLSEYLMRCLWAYEETTMRAADWRRAEREDTVSE